MNNSNKLTLISLGLLSSLSVQVHPAPGVLSDIPPDISTYVQPNILFLLDDSSSMHWEMLYTKEAEAIYPSETSISGTHSRTAHQIDITPSSFEEYLDTCAGINTLYYNPTVTYEPWKGKDSGGVTFGNQPTNAVRKNPYDASEGVVDLDADAASIGYLPWVDADGDGEFDQYECGEDDTATNFVTYDSLGFDKQNFANWYSYYRKREHVAKKALSEVITATTARAGLATLNANSTGETFGGIPNTNKGLLIKDLDNISVPLNPTADANKNALLERLFQVESLGLTPLRKSLKRAGEYFDENVNPSANLFGPPASHLHDASLENTLTDKTPILNAASGGACQQNFTILFSDGSYNGSSPGVGNADADGPTSDFDGGTFADSYSNTLADVAMKYYEEDLSGTLANTLTLADRHQSGVTINHQHMNTYTLAFGVNGLLDANPDEPGFEIEGRTATASAATFDAGSVSTGARLFQGIYDTADWTGDLLAFDFDSNGVVDTSGNGTIGNEDAVWSAAAQLNASLPTTWANRNVITYNGTQGVPFAAPLDFLSPGPGEISGSMIADLLSHSHALSIPIGDTIAQQTFVGNIINFLKGDNTLEGIIFHNRNGKYLGPIIHSAPQYMGTTMEPYPDLIESTAYSTFKPFKSSRTPMVFAGGNDGMLHGFNANTGNETFAYIPGFLSNNLSALAETSFSYKPYVDATPVIRDVFVSKSPSPAAWRTYLVGGVRTGGKGVYVLDVTSPSALATADDSSSNAKSIVVTEFTHPDLGYTFSRPQIA